MMHYLSHTTVEYFREFIRYAKQQGKHIMRVDQCLEDPDAPALGWSEYKGPIYVTSDGTPFDKTASVRRRHKL